jgi:hypothetical protein
LRQAFPTLSLSWADKKFATIQNANKKAILFMAFVLSNGKYK